MEWQKNSDARDAFSEFVNELGYVGWHIHDGWVCKDSIENCGNKVLEFNEIDLIVISSNEGYGHNLNQQLKESDKLVIIKDSPSFEDHKQIRMYCYEITKMIRKNKVHLKRIEIKKVKIENNNFKLIKK